MKTWPKRRRWTNLRRFSLLCLSLLAVPVFAAKIQVIVGAEGEREAWVLPERPAKMPVSGQKFTAASFPLAVPEGMERGVVIVHDLGSGNIALRALESIEGGQWAIKPKEWRVAQVKVEAFTRGNPLPTGRITLEGAGYDQQLPVENGGAVFFAVPSGDIKCTVHYTSSGAMRSSSQTFRLELKRQEAVPDLAITIKDKVDAIPTAKRTPEREGSAPANFVIYLLGLGAAIAGFWYLFQFLRKNEGSVAEALKKAGVQIPGEPPPQDEPAGVEPFQEPPIVPEGHCRFCGQPLAADGSCACQIGHESTVSAIHEAKLIGPVTLVIQEGSHTLGREAELLVTDPTVSRNHAEVSLQSGKVTISDLGSSNGTYVNGTKLQGETELSPGDTVQFGAVKFRFEG
jgi:hypothetical protein